MIAASPTQAQTLTALASFLAEVLPKGVQVVQAQGNRVPEPSAPDFVVMTPRERLRLETNTDSYLDTLFAGSIAGDVLTVTAVSYGTVAPGDPVYGTGVATGTNVTAQLSGTAGGIGTYQIDTPQQASQQPMAAGANDVLQPTELTVQLDVHGPNSADNAQTVSTLFRDDFACEFFAGVNPAIQPLHADDPRQMPFVNDQNQYEWRWIVEARLQANIVVTVGQQFAAALEVDLISVDEAYPP